MPIKGDGLRDYWSLRLGATPGVRTQIGTDRDEFVRIGRALLDWEECASRWDWEDYVAAWCIRHSIFNIRQKIGHIDQWNLEGLRPCWARLGCATTGF